MIACATWQLPHLHDRSFPLTDHLDPPPPGPQVPVVPSVLHAFQLHAWLWQEDKVKDLCITGDGWANANNTKCAVLF